MENKINNQNKFRMTTQIQYKNPMYAYQYLGEDNIEELKNFLYEIIPVIPCIIINFSADTVETKMKRFGKKGDCICIVTKNTDNYMVEKNDWIVIINNTISVINEQEFNLLYKKVS